MMDLDSFHSIDALSSALVALRTEFSTLFGISCIIQDFGLRRSAYEPYRLFHTYRYCYLNEGIEWKKDGSEFTRSARYVEGIESVALNLYANAVKYLSRYKGEKIVRTTFKEFGNHVEISISSMGPEIMPDEMPRILNGGYRARSVQNKYPGLGRGISRIKNLRRCRIWFFHFSRTTIKIFNGRGAAVDK